MPEVSETLIVDVPISDVWQLIGGFETMHSWHPAISESEIFERGGITYRRLTLTSGDTIVESMDEHSDEDKSYSYTMTDFGPLPLSAYSATLSVVLAGNVGSEIRFAGTFEVISVPNFVVAKAVSKIFRSGLDGIATHFAASA